MIEQLTMRIIRIVAIAVLFQGIIHSNLIAQNNIYKLHSLFIYNFTKHVQWAEVGETFTIGVFGNDVALQAVKSSFVGKKFNGKEIRVINIAGIGDANVSQLVYMPKSNKGKILNLFEDVDKTNTLFVSEDDFIAEGFPISFYILESKLAFKVSKKNLDASGLKISTSLLSLATVVD